MKSQSFRIAALAAPGRRHCLLPSPHYAGLDERNVRRRARVAARGFTIKPSRQSAPHGKVSFEATHKALDQARLSGSPERRPSCSPTTST